MIPSNHEIKKPRCNLELDSNLNVMSTIGEITTKKVLDKPEEGVSKTS